MLITAWGCCFFSWSPCSPLTTSLHPCECIPNDFIMARTCPVHSKVPSPSAASQKSGISTIFYVFKGVSSAHSGCIYSIKNTEKNVILWNLNAISNIGFLYFKKLFIYDIALNFQHHYSSLQCHIVTVITVIIINLICLLNKSINFFKKRKYWPQTFE